jgi:hypothetical protein
MTNHPIGHALTRFGEWATHPRRLRGAPLRRSMASIFHAATELIVLIIVRSEHRNTQAILTLLPARAS